MRAFLRIILVIPVGFMLAIAAAIAVYLTAFGFGEQDLWGGPGGDVPVIVAPVMVLLADIAKACVLPFLGAIVLAEIFSIRSMIAWMLFGGALGLGVQLFAFPGNMELLPPVAAGFVGGFAYWLVAGRAAGAISTAPE